MNVDSMILSASRARGRFAASAVIVAVVMISASRAFSPGDSLSLIAAGAVCLPLLCAVLILTPAVLKLFPSNQVLAAVGICLLATLVFMGFCIYRIADVSLSKSGAERAAAEAIKAQANAHEAEAYERILARIDQIGKAAIISRADVEQVTDSILAYTNEFPSHRAKADALLSKLEQNIDEKQNANDLRQAIRNPPPNALVHSADPSDETPSAPADTSRRSVSRPSAPAPAPTQDAGSSIPAESASLSYVSSQQATVPRDEPTRVSVSRPTNQNGQVSGVESITMQNGDIVEFQSGLSLPTSPEVVDFTVSLKHSSGTLSILWCEYSDSSFVPALPPSCDKRARITRMVRTTYVLQAGDGPRHIFLGFRTGQP